mmetsp:Transcript_11838/g.44025  ORF Transcript_11838/g.44025 Transcript_11838/m.44025 type:complete len:301 (+) Transcript_11838:743-1645(+)
MLSATASLTSASFPVPKISGLVRARDNMFAATSSSFALVPPLSFASIAAFCVFHFGSISETRMCSAMSSTAMSSPVMGETANFVASAPPGPAKERALASAASTSGFLWSRTIFIPTGAGRGAAAAATPSAIIARSSSSIGTSPSSSCPVSAGFKSLLDPEAGPVASTGASASRACATMSLKVMGSGKSSSSPSSKSMVSTTAKSCQSTRAKASRSFSTSSSADRFALSTERSHSSRCNARSSRKLFSVSFFKTASRPFGGCKTFAYASANFWKTECMECVVFRNANSLFPCSFLASCVMN